MAVMIPETAGSNVTAGEREIFQMFKKYLPEDWVVYHNPVILGKEMDFVVIAKGHGIVILEAKDYLAKNIVSISPDTWELSTIDTKPICPIKQALGYARQIDTCLKRDIDLVHSEGKLKGRLKFPYGKGVILTRITEQEIVKLRIDEVIPTNQLITKTDIQDEDWIQNSLIEKLISMLNFQFGRGALGDNEILRIRYHLFPELRIGKTDEGIHIEDNLYKFRTIEAMDVYQERVAKGLGAGHRLIRGVAGSGKTLILAARAKYLAIKNPGWNILVLTNASILASSIDNTISELVNRDEDKDKVSLSNIETLTFSFWFYKTFKTILLNDLTSFIEDLSNIKGKPMYDAILIDEGQDFPSDWYKIVLSCLNPETGSFLIVEDKAQNIFSRKINFAQEIGLNFRGRSNILQINYRNTKQIAEFAWKFFNELSGEYDNTNDESSGGVQIISPKMVNRNGNNPIVRRMDNYSMEIALVVSWIKQIVKDEKGNERDIAILYRVKKIGKQQYVEPLLEALKQNQIPASWSSSDSISKKQFKKTENTIKVMSLDSAKGLDFKIIFIINADNIPLPFLKEEFIQSEISRMYVGMTRATENLIITYSGNSIVTNWLDTTIFI